MRIAMVAIAILLLGVGSFRQLHREIQHERGAAQQMEIEIAEAVQRATGATNQAAQLANEGATLRRDAAGAAKPPTTIDNDKSAPPAESLPSPGDQPSWPETGAFAWIDKRQIRALGLTAFRAADSPDREIPSEIMRLINRIGREFTDAHPEFGRVQELSPDDAARASAEYKKAVLDATSSLDEAARKSVTTLMQSVDQIPIPGRMSQSAAEYQLNRDVATVLGLTAAEQDGVMQVTRDIVQRHQSLERLYVVPIDVPSPASNLRTAERVSFRIAAFPDEGRRLREEWASQLEALIGAQRASFLQEMSSTWIGSDLGEFGEAERTITFTEKRGSFGVSDRNDRGYSANTGTGGPAPVPPGWRHLIVRPPEGGPPALRF